MPVFQPTTGVALGPVLGSFAIALGKYDLLPGRGTLEMGHAAPGILAAALCLGNIAFAWRYLTESRVVSEPAQAGEIFHTSRQAMWRVISDRHRFRTERRGSIAPSPLIVGDGSWQGFLQPGRAVGTSTGSRLSGVAESVVDNR